MLNALALVAQEDHGPTGFSSPFEVNFGLFFWTWVVFILLFWALKRFAWPAILRATEERERKIAAQLEEAERHNAEARQALEEQQRLLRSAKNDAQQLISDAKSLAGKERQSLLEQARQEHDQMLDRAKREIVAERERAIIGLRREAVELSLAAASRLIEERLDGDRDRKLVADYLASLGGQH